MKLRDRRCVVIALSAMLFLTAFTWAPAANVLPYWLKVEKILDNAAELGAVAESPSGELWLLERATGNVRVYAAGKQSATLTISVYSTGESGLLGVAFAPDHAATGRAFVYYVDAARNLRVDQVNRGPASLTLGSQILSLGTVPASGLRVGGGIAIGKDGKLYVSVGDLELPASAQNDANLTGKVLRANLDGSVPADNPSGALVWAKGFRNGKGMAVNPTTTRASGTVYVTDAGQSAAPSAADEVNQVIASGNYAWSNCSGTGCGAPYVDPLATHASTALAGVDAVASNFRSALGSSHVGSIAYAAVTTDDVKEAFLTGADLDQLSRSAVLFDPDGDYDGNPATDVCPKLVNEVALGNEGWLYMANRGANPGIWRIWRDTPGPREVSTNGSPFPLTVDKSGSNLVIGWENLGTLDTGRPARNAGQQAERYQVWEGTLPITAYDHVAILNTNGTPDGPARLTATITPGSGSRYYLVNAQGDNRTGSLGYKEASGTQTQRPGVVDYCGTIGYGNAVGNCAKDFVNPVNGEPMKLVDYNPNSPTYNQAVSVGDFRGRVVKLDLSADNCFWCNVQADQEAANDTKYRDRDFLFITVLTLTYALTDPIPPANCATVIGGWASRHSSKTPILCDVDMNGDNRGDVTAQYWHAPDCGGTPQNFYVDQGNLLYNFVCGAQLSGDVDNAIKNEVNPETCE